MTSLLRQIATTFENRLKISVSRVGREGLALERSHLKRCIADFGVDCIFDVGANIGQYFDLLREIGYMGTVISFEPIPALAKELRDRARNDQRWIIEEVALSDAVCEVPLHIMEYSEFSSLRQPSENETSSLATYNKHVKSVSVTTGLLQTYYEKYERSLKFSRPFLKMDTQGNDLNVARGAGDTLKRFVALQSELSIKRLYADQPSFSEAIQFYRSEGFEVCSIIPNHPHFPELIEVDCIMYNPALT